MIDEEALIERLNLIGQSLQEQNRLLDEPCPEENDLAIYAAILRKQKRRSRQHIARIETHLKRCNRCFQTIVDSLNALTLLAHQNPSPLETAFRLFGKSVAFIDPLSLALSRTVIREDRIMPMLGDVETRLGDWQIKLSPKLVKGEFQLVVQVINWKERKAVENARVQLLTPKRQLLSMQTTDSSGRVKFNALPEGDYLVQLYEPRRVI